MRLPAPSQCPASSTARVVGEGPELYSSFEEESVSDKQLCDLGGSSTSRAEGGCAEQ